MKKWLGFFLIFALIVSWLFKLYNDYSFVWDTIQIIENEEESTINDFLNRYNDWEFSKIELKDNKDLIWYVFVSSGSTKSSALLNKTYTEHKFDTYTTQKPFDTSLTDLWISLTWDVLVEVQYTTKSFLQKFFEEVWPILLFFVIFLVFFRFMMPKGGAGFPFNAKAGKLEPKTKHKTRFADVAGMEEVKNELSEVVDYLKNPEKYHKVWARHPKGVLLFGEPGSGKTLLARAVAWESNVAFFSVSGSEFMEMLVGMWAAKVRDLFGKAKAAGRAIIFIDEIDAIGRKRWMGHTWWHQEQEQTLNQILTEMDGFDNKTNIIVMAATNRPDILDSALLRAGRFDRKIMVSRPTLEERISIFQYYLKNKKVEAEVSLESLAKRTSGLVWADIENIVNEASLKIAKESRTKIGFHDFEYALEKVLMWPEKKVKSMNEKEKEIVAIHELWHAITAYFLPQTDPVEKISIVRRWYALGVTWMIPEEDKNLYSKAKFLDEVVSLLWGRAAEEVFFGKDEITTWASNDFEKSTTIIRNMITKYGMDSELGTISYWDNDMDDYKFLKPYSEKTSQLIDKKTQEYMSDSYKKSISLIKKNKESIIELSKILLEKEYLTREEFELFMSQKLGK